MRTSIVIVMLCIIVIAGALVYLGFKTGTKPCGEKIIANIKAAEENLKEVKEKGKKVYDELHQYYSQQKFTPQKGEQKNVKKVTPTATQPPLTPRLDALEKKDKERGVQIANLQRENEQQDLKTLVAINLEKWNRERADQKIKQVMAAGFKIANKHFQKDNDPYSASEVENFLKALNLP